MFMPHVHCTIIHSSHDIERTQCPPMDELIEKIGLYTQWNIIQPLRKKEILSSMTMWMNLEGIC